MRHTIVLLLSCVHLLACDANKAVGVPLNLTVRPNSTHTETWDFSQCYFGIRNDSFYLDFKATKDLEVRLFDATTGIEYAGAQNQRGIVFYCINDCESVSGHVLCMTFTNSGRKTVAVEIQQAVCWCN